LIEIILAVIIGGSLSAVLSYFVFKNILKLQTERFQVIATDVLSQNSTSLKTQALEHKNYLDELHRFDIKERENIRTKINQMLESADKIGAEAGQLTRALSSDVKFQGSWGELTLERILELAGLEKNTEYFTQQSYKDDEGKNLRPDVIIQLPNDSHIIIDSKVSLKAYFDYVNTDDKSKALKNLKLSIQTHIDSLAKKNYQKLKDLKTPDFVYLFIPVEGVYSLILKEYPELIDESIKKNIVLVSPVNIIANLKTVAALWRLEKQSKNTEEMARKAGAMYDKFVGLVDDFEKVGVHLQRAQDSHGEVHKKLFEGKGNLISRAEELKGLGAKTSKSIH
jgi:DNA recombination protein RmuC